jgi:hypothetical protein
VGLGTDQTLSFIFFLSPSVDSFSARFGRYCAAATVDATGTITVFFFLSCQSRPFVCLLASCTNERGRGSSSSHPSPRPMHSRVSVRRTVRLPTPRTILYRACMSAGYHDARHYRFIMESFTICTRQSKWVSRRLAISECQQRFKGRVGSTRATASRLIFTRNWQKLTVTCLLTWL